MLVSHTLQCAFLFCLILQLCGSFPCFVSVIQNLSAGSTVKSWSVHKAFLECPDQNPFLCLFSFLLVAPTGLWAPWRQELSSYLNFSSHKHYLSPEIPVSSHSNFILIRIFVVWVFFVVVRIRENTRFCGSNRNWHNLDDSGYCFLPSFYVVKELHSTYIKSVTVQSRLLSVSFGWVIVCKCKFELLSEELSNFFLASVWKMRYRVQLED